MNKHSKRLLTLAALATTTTATIHIINKVIAASACLKEMLDTDVRNYYHWRFGDIYYTKKGKGSPILLIHDMLPGGSGLNGPESRMNLHWNIPYIIWIFRDADVLRSRV